MQKQKNFLNNNESHTKTLIFIYVYICIQIFSIRSKIEFQF